jgi:tRNA 2-thiouridine synthesizing protein A
MSDVLTEADCELDVRGLDFPLPILKAKKAMRDLRPGQVMHVIATDPGSASDFRLLCTQTGNELRETFEQNGEFHFYIRRS